MINNKELVEEFDQVFYKLYRKLNRDLYWEVNALMKNQEIEQLYEELKVAITVENKAM